MLASHRKSIPSAVVSATGEVEFYNLVVENPNTPPDHDDTSNIEFPPEELSDMRVKAEPRMRRGSRLSQSLQRNSSSCIKSADVTLWRSEVDKELETGLKMDDEYFRSEQRQRQQAEFRALLDAIKTE